MFRVFVFTACNASPAWSLAAYALDQIGVAENIIGREEFLHKVEFCCPNLIGKCNSPIHGAVSRHTICHEIAVVT